MKTKNQPPGTGVNAIAARAETVTLSSDAALVSQAKSGDTRAFEALYRAHCGRVHALCLRMTRNTTEAEDLTQEAFVRAWRKLESFRGDSAFGTWLHRLTVNLVLTNRRNHTRRAERVTTTDDLAPFERVRETPGPGLGMDIERAIAQLPEGARNVFVLHDVEGYRHHEIAGMLGIAVGTTKAQLHRARRILRKALT
jgi:RNA polymerase sigma-70 factor (ECF subfamily)